MPELAIELLAGTAAAAIDLAASRVALADGRTLPYDRLLLAMGGRARALAVPGGERALTLRTLEDARALRARLVPGARVVCIGAGVIGLEVAASAHARGCRVTVLEAAATALGRCTTPEMAEWVVGLHRRAGVAVHFGAAVAAIEPDAVVCADGLRVPADLVVAGIGMTRNTELAAAAGPRGGQRHRRRRMRADQCWPACSPPATWRRSGSRGSAAGCGWNPGATRRTTASRSGARWRAARRRMTRCRGSGPTSTAAPSRSPGCPPRPRRPCCAARSTDASFCAFHLDADGRVVAATGVDAPREVRAAMALIRAGAAVDPARLADPAVKPQALLPR